MRVGGMWALNGMWALYGMWAQHGMWALHGMVSECEGADLLCKECAEHATAVLKSIINDSSC